MQGLTAAQSNILAFIEERLETHASPPTCREICARFGYKSPKAAADHLSALERKGFLLRNPKRARGIKLSRQSGIPLLGQIVAGMPSEGIRSAERYIPIDPVLFGINDRRSAFALQVRGDSMEGRSIFDGDIVLLESGATPRHESVVAALIDNESTLKTFLQRDGKTWLRAENPKYPELIPAWDLQIQGVARAVIRNLPK